MKKRGLSAAGAVRRPRFSPEDWGEEDSVAGHPT